MTAYKSSAEGITCLRHNQTFAPSGPQAFCPGCIVDPAPIEDTEDDQTCPAPTGCESTEDLERTLLGIAKQLEQDARRIMKNANTSIGKDTANAIKAYDTAIKAYRAAGEYALEREDKNHTKRLERLKKKLAK